MIPISPPRSFGCYFAFTHLDEFLHTAHVYIYTSIIMHLVVGWRLWQPFYIFILLLAIWHFLWVFFFSFCCFGCSRRSFQKRLAYFRRGVIRNGIFYDMLFAINVMHIGANFFRFTPTIQILLIITFNATM